MPSCRGWAEAAARPGWETALQGVKAAAGQRGCHGSLPAVPGTACPDVQPKPPAAESQGKHEGNAPTLSSLPHFLQLLLRLFGWFQGYLVSCVLDLPCQRNLEKNTSISQEWIPQKQGSACGVSRDTLLTPAMGAGLGPSIHPWSWRSPPCRHTCKSTATEASAISADLHGHH